MKTRKIHIDILRILALFLVIYTHTGEQGMHYYITVDGGAGYWASFSLAILTQCSVCIFFMISGALLLGRNESFSYVLKKRIFRMVVVIVVMVALQYLYMCCLNSTAPGIKQYAELLYHGGAITQQWFLYAYLSFLLILPFLQRLVKGIEDNSWYEYLFFAVIILGGLCPLAERFLDFKEAGISFPFMESIIFYPLMGYYLENKCTKTIKGIGRFALLAAVMIIYAFNTWLARRGYVNTGTINSLSYFTPLYTMVIFKCVKDGLAGVKLSGKARGIIAFCGTGVFGTYLFEQQLRDVFDIIYTELRPVTGHFPACFLWIAVCMIVGITVFGGLRRLPVLKHFL